MGPKDDDTEEASDVWGDALPEWLLEVGRGGAADGRGELAEGGVEMGGKKDDACAREAKGVQSPRPASTATRVAHCRSNASQSCRDEIERVMSRASAWRAQKSL